MMTHVSGPLWELLVSLALRDVGSVPAEVVVERLQNLVDLRECHEL
jgi:hypothetical protein